MQYYQELLNQILLNLENLITVEFSNNSQHYTVKGIVVNQVVDCVKSNHNDHEIYYMVHYAAKSNLIEVEWLADGNGINKIIDITPSGHEMLKRLHEECLVK